MPKTTDAPEPRTKSLFEQLKEGLAIDKHNLDECWIEQPDIFYRVSEGLAKANQAIGENEAAIKQAKVDAAEDIRKAFERDDKKLTIAELDRQVDADERVNDLRAVRAGLDFTQQKWQGLLEAYRQRGFSLKGLTDLHSQNYYQTNSGGAPRDRVADTTRSAAGEERRQRPAKA